MLICMFAGQTAASTTALARPAAARVDGTTSPTAHASSAMPDAITSGPSHRRSARGMIGVNTPGRTRWMTPDTANGTITIQGTVAAGFFARDVAMGIIVVAAGDGVIAAAVVVGQRRAEQAERDGAEDDIALTHIGLGLTGTESGDGDGSGGNACDELAGHGNTPFKRLIIGWRDRSAPRDTKIGAVGRDRQ